MPFVKFHKNPSSIIQQFSSHLYVYINLQSLEDLNLQMYHITRQQQISWKNKIPQKCSLRNLKFKKQVKKIAIAKIKTLSGIILISG